MPGAAAAAASGGDGGDADDETDLRPEFIGLTVVEGRVVGVDGGGGSAGAVPAADLSHGRGGAGARVSGSGAIGGGGVGAGRLGSCTRQRSEQGPGGGLEKGAQGVHVCVCVHWREGSVVCCCR